MSEIIPGRYETLGVNSVSCSSIGDAGALAALRGLAERASAGEITPEQATAEAEKIAPGAGALFDVRTGLIKPRRRYTRRLSGQLR
jgi:hypothetical protein